MLSTWGEGCGRRLIRCPDLTAVGVTFDERTGLDKSLILSCLVSLSLIVFYTYLFRHSFGWWTFSCSDFTQLECDKSVLYVYFSLITRPKGLHRLPPLTLVQLKKSKKKRKKKDISIYYTRSISRKVTGRNSRRLNDFSISFISVTNRISLFF